MNHTKFIVKRGKGGTKIWLSESYVREVCGVSEGYLKTARFRAAHNDKASWQYTKIDAAMYYDYESIPSKAPSRFKELFPSHIDLIRESMTATHQIETGEAVHKLREAMELKYKREDAQYYMWQSRVTFAQDKAEDLARGLALHRILSEAAHTGIIAPYGVCRVSDLYAVAATLICMLSLYGTATKSAASLRNRIAGFLPLRGDAQLDYMIPASFGNDNSKVVGKKPLIDEQTGEVMGFDLYKTVMLYLWLNVGKPNKEHKVTLYYEEYVPILRELGLDRIISYRTFCAHTDQLYTKVWGSKERDGSHVFNTQYKTYVAAAKLQYSNSLWVADGSGWKLAFNKGGKAATLYAIRIFDVASQAIIGWHIIDGRGERTEHVQKALAMALNTSGGYAAMDFLSDNGGAFTDGVMKKKMKMIFPVVRTIAPGNSQANPAEMFIKLINKLGRKYENWTESSFAAKATANRANPDYMDIAALPTVDACYSQILDMITAWNKKEGADGLSPLQRFHANRNPQSARPSDKAVRYAFGGETELAVANMRGYINTRHDGSSYQYTIPDYTENLEKISRACGWVGAARVKVYFDSKGCDVYTLEGEYILSCLPTELAHKSYSEATDGSSSALGKATQRKNAMDNKANRMVEDVVDGMELIRYDHRTAFQSKDVKEDSNEMQDAHSLAQYANNKPSKERKHIHQLTREEIAQRAFDEL